MEKNYVMLKTEYGIKGINLEKVLEFEIRSLENGENIIKIFHSKDYNDSYYDDVAFENEFKRMSDIDDSRLVSKDLLILNLRGRHLLNFNEVKEKLMKLFDESKNSVI